MFHFWETMHFGTVDYFALPIMVLVLVALALAFDFSNGIHDAANSIATVVSTRVLSPWTAVVWAAFFNFVAFAVFHLKVAGTMGKGLIEPGIVDNSLIAATLFNVGYDDGRNRVRRLLAIAAEATNGGYREIACGGLRAV